MELIIFSFMRRRVHFPEVRVKELNLVSYALMHSEEVALLQSKQEDIIPNL